ncbi:DUF1878 domain-containing protein [Paenibacillus larvae]
MEPSFLHNYTDSTFAFYHQIINYDLDEQIEKSVLCIISLFNNRLSKNDNLRFEKDYFDSIGLDVIYDVDVTPTIDEYESYLQKLSIPIDPKYLLMAINKQKESDDACQYLLQQYK